MVYPHILLGCLTGNYLGKGIHIVFHKGHNGHVYSETFFVASDKDRKKYNICVSNSPKTLNGI